MGSISLSGLLQTRLFQTQTQTQSLFWVMMISECAPCCSSWSNELPGHFGDDQTWLRVPAQTSAVPDCPCRRR